MRMVYVGWKDAVRCEFFRMLQFVTNVQRVLCRT